MARYGSDKPDLRMGLELVECTDYFKDTPFRVFQARVRRRGRDARAARASPASSSTPGRSGPSSAAPRAWPTCWSRRTASSAARSPRTSPTRRRPAWPPTSAPQPGDCVFFAAGAAKSSRALLGAARLEIGRRGGLIDESAWSFLWVVDAPLFEPAVDATAAVTSRSAAARGPRSTTPSPSAAGPRHLRHRPRQRAGLGLRHRLQRQRDRRRVDPYPPRGRPEAGLRGHGPRRGGGRRRSSASCWTPSSTARRRTAASRSAGTGSARCSPAPTRSAT